MAAVAAPRTSVSVDRDDDPIRYTMDFRRNGLVVSVMIREAVVFSTSIVVCDWLGEI